MVVTKPKKIRLGDLLVEHKIITQEQLNIALENQKSSGQKLGRVLIDKGFLSEDKLLDFLAHQLNIDYVDLKRFEIRPEVVKLIPETQARRFRVIALKQDAEGVLLAMADPTNIFAYDEIRAIIARPLKLAVVKESDLLKVIDTVYRRTAEITSFAAELEQQITATEDQLGTRGTTDNVADAPVVKLLQTMFEDAVQINASDMHIEPGQTELVIRFRIDGVLRTQTTTDRRIAGALLTRLKLMAQLDISERRLPQDGRFNLRVHDKSIDVRVSTMPLETGEAAVLRLLNQSAGALDLDHIGMPPAILTKLRQIVRSPHGILLVTGPTGSGKTTTLYAMLREVNDSSVKIITVEDPVEYRLPGISQVQVNPKVDLTFVRVLRAVLRHDPDIILIGEMRDVETVQIGLRAAMTGHFVLSTLHTNDAISSVLRLVDMGAEPYLIAGAVRAIVAQRLVRRICDNCAVEHDLDANVRSVLKEDLASLPSTTAFKKGSGCSYCNHSGYLGRIGVYEALIMTPELVELLHQGDVLGFSKKAAHQPGYQTLRQSTLLLAAKGLTTVDEVLRVGLTLEV